MKVGQLCSQHKPIVQALREVQRVEKLHRNILARRGESTRLVERGIATRRRLLAAVNYFRAYPCAACQTLKERPACRLPQPDGDNFYLCLRSSIESAEPYGLEVLGSIPGAAPNFEVVTI